MQKYYISKNKNRHDLKKILQFFLFAATKLPVKVMPSLTNPMRVIIIMAKEKSWLLFMHSFAKVKIQPLEMYWVHLFMEKGTTNKTKCFFFLICCFLIAESKKERLFQQQWKTVRSHIKLSVRIGVRKCVSMLAGAHQQQPWLWHWSSQLKIC